MSGEKTEWLANLLYADAKHVVASTWKYLARPIRRSSAKTFHSIGDLSLAIQSGEIQPDTLVDLKCRPSHFLPTSRGNFIPPIIGMNSSLRRGPQIGSDKHPLLGLLNQVTHHLAPVTMAPPIGDVIQVSLHDIDVPISDLVTNIDLGPMKVGTSNIPAILNTRFQNFLHKECRIKAVVRMLDPNAFSRLSDSMDTWEAFRASGKLFFLDMHVDDADAELISDQPHVDHWGGIMFDGHIELASGTIDIDSVIEDLLNTVRNAGYDPTVQNASIRGGEYHDTYIFGRGVRASFSPNGFRYSVHMDCNLSTEYEKVSARLQLFEKTIHSSFKRSVDSGLADIDNLTDVNFHWKNSLSESKILSSATANSLDEKFSVAIRDWHRKKYS